MTFPCFLKQMMLYKKPVRKMLVMFNNFSSHYTNVLTLCLTEDQAFVCLDYLPLYSPHWNNIETMSKLTRRPCTHNQYFPRVKDIADAIFHWFNICNHPQKPCAVYAQLNRRIGCYGCDSAVCREFCQD